MASIKPIVEKLEDLFSVFNGRYYDGKLQRPVITVSQDVTSGAFGWLTSWKAWKEQGCDDGEGYYEINICAEHLTRPFEEVCATLLHEMVHLYNIQNDIKDTSRSGTYHNKKFKLVAEEHGLNIDQHEKYGWTITSLNDDAKEFISSMDEEGFTLSRTKMSKVEKAKGSKKSSSRKYMCPDCGVIVRATKEVRIICKDCDIELELEE